MPIYGDKLTSTQYKVVRKISVKDFRDLLDTFKDAKGSFPYKNKYYFLRSIELDEAGKSVKDYDEKVIIDIIFDLNYRKNLKGKFPFIAKFYNDPRLNIDEYNYSVMMESLIHEANKILPKKIN